jgi:hypothetical protein
LNYGLIDEMSVLFEDFVHFFIIVERSTNASFLLLKRGNF